MTAHVARGTIPPAGGTVSTGSAHGTAGEIVQGQRDGRDFLITLPIELRSSVRVSCATGPAAVRPHYVTKSRRLLELLRPADRGPGGCDCPTVDVEINSTLPVGAGMASSSADLVALARALDAHWNIGLTAARIATLAASIEPTDGVMYDGPVVFDHITGRLLSGPYADLECLVVLVDPAVAVDTVNFRRLAYTPDELAATAYAHDLAVDGLAASDLEAVGTAATRSAWVNQRRQHKQLLGPVVAVAGRHRGAGVAVAHSGSVLAVLFDLREHDRATSAAAEIREFLPAPGRVQILHTGPGRERGDAP